MHGNIAVYVGDNGETASLFQRGRVVVYQRRAGRWNVVREREVLLDQRSSIKDLRQKMEDIVDFIDDCKVFVGLSVVGVPYFELEKNKFSIWEFEGNPGEFLDYVLEKEEEAGIQAREEGQNNLPIAPTETNAGCYVLSLKEIQENNLGVTSKQVLLPFLRRGKFYSLELLCNHIPPWLETELAQGHYNWEVKIISNSEVLVYITKKCCQ